MQEQNAAKLLAHVMQWGDLQNISDTLRHLQLLSDYKYDHYQRFAPGRRFIESLALWINRFDEKDREAALSFVLEKLIFFSEEEMSHLVSTAYPDLIVQERIRLVSEELDIDSHKVIEISRHPRFKEMKLKSLYLGLSDGARTNELRRASKGDIGNEQIWQAYELGEEKAEDMTKELASALEKAACNGLPLFNVIWLLDDFSGSGNTYIRYDNDAKKFKGKIPKIYERMTKGDLVDPQHYEVFLLLYVATRQAIDHIEYWVERFTSQNGYKPLQVRVLCPVEPKESLRHIEDADLKSLLMNDKYCDQVVVDTHFQKGGTSTANMGFAGCALPLVLSHNTPNNSVYILWGPDNTDFEGLFPRISRHREF